MADLPGTLFRRIVYIRVYNETMILVRYRVENQKAPINRGFREVGSTGFEPVTPCL